MNQREDVQLHTILARQQPNPLIGMRRPRSFIANLEAKSPEIRTSLKTHLLSSRTTTLHSNSAFGTLRCRTVRQWRRICTTNWSSTRLHHCWPRFTLPASIPCRSVDFTSCAVDSLLYYNDVNVIIQPLQTEAQCQNKRNSDLKSLG